nr:MAG TPA: holin [Caudoviricetes sp.]
MNIKVMQLTLIMTAIVADYLTGLIKACYKHEYKSEVMRQGLYHKIAEIAAVAVMFYLELGLPMIGIAIDFPFISFITLYIIVMELSSIIENIGEINPDLIGPLSDVFEKVKQVKDDKYGKTN